VLLALAPHLVRTDRLAPGATGALHDLLPELRRGGVAAVSPSGVLGDPTGASAGEGWALLQGWTDALVESFDHWDRRSA
jgi:creatinine amidohydrolase